MKNMIKTLVASIMVMFVTTSAMAGNVERPNVYHHYKDVIQQVPYNVEVCRNVTTHSGGASTGDVLGGAIIGGIIGNQIGKGKGNDAATILGAILGADMANKNKQGTSTTGTHCSIETRYKETSVNVYSHSTLTFMVDGKGYTVDYIHQF